MRQSRHFMKLSSVIILCGAAAASAQEPGTPMQPPAPAPVTPQPVVVEPSPVVVTPPPPTSTEPAPTVQVTTGDQQGPYIDTETTQTKLPNRPLLTTGSTFFLGSYIPTVIAAAVNDDDTSDDLYIPIAGPWMEIARHDNSSGNKALLSISGVFQGLGGLGILSSFMIPERRTKSWYLIGNKRFNVMPVASRNTYGLGARGAF